MFLAVTSPLAFGSSDTSVLTVIFTFLPAFFYVAGIPLGWLLFRLVQYYYGRNGKKP